MEQKEIKIQVPDGYEVDEENSTFAEIKFKPIVAKYPKSWEDAFIDKMLDGYYVRRDSEIDIYNGFTRGEDKNVFKTKKQTRAMVAYAQITQLMALPCYNGDWTPDWNDNSQKWMITRSENDLLRAVVGSAYFPIAFKSEEARDAFWRNHQDLLKQYHQL